MEQVLEYIERNIQDFVDELIRICEVPAPPFQEERRGKYFGSLFQELGYPVHTDEIGNVLVSIREADRPRVVLSAHLDTVFPVEDIRVRREGKVLHAPGISDDSAGLAALYFLCCAFTESSLPGHGSLSLLASVGEEGLGNLRGVTHFFTRHAGEVDYFVSLDGSDAERLVTAGLGSMRIRVYLRGPGGHSWGDAGVSNPIHAAGELLSRIQRLSLPTSPKTVVNVGIISGGTSINAIPTEMYMDIDLRSESAEHLRNLEGFVRSCVDEAVRPVPGIQPEVRLLGERPSGSISTNHPLVLSAIAANRRFGLQAKTEYGSTDSNIPFALGIPALTTGVGGKCGKVHTPDEWYDVSDVIRGLKRTAVLLSELLNMTP